MLPEVKNPCHPGICRKQNKTLLYKLHLIWVFFVFWVLRDLRWVWITAGSRTSPKSSVFYDCFRKVPLAGAQEGFRSLSVCSSRILAAGGGHTALGSMDNSTWNWPISAQGSPCFLSLPLQCCKLRGDPGQSRKFVRVKTFVLIWKTDVC